LAFVLALRRLRDRSASADEFARFIRPQTLSRFLKLLRAEFEFPSSLVWDSVCGGGRLPSSVSAILRCEKIVDLLAPDPGDEDDEPRDELWLASMHRDLDPQCALELRELATEIWSGLCAGELRVPERWQGADELLAFLNECGLQISETDYKRMLKRNKARRWRATKSQ